MWHVVLQGDWCLLAEEMEIDQHKHQYRLVRPGNKLQPERRGKEARTTQAQPRSTSCFKCRKKDHQIVNCHNKMPEKRRDHQPSGRSTKAALCQKESALRTVEFLELSQPHGVEVRALTPPDSDSEATESDYDDDSLVSGSIDPIITVHTDHWEEVKTNSSAGLGAATA